MARRIYAIGDVHGCDDRLAALHQRIAMHLRVRPAERPLLVHLGDYIDRGARSAAVIDRLLAGVEGFETVNLSGNHERTALHALDGEPGAIADWLAYGGRETLASWGIDPRAGPQEWRARVPPDHLAFLRGLPLSFQEGGYLFVHAGIRPGIPLADQTDADLLSIRMPFLYSEMDFGFVVVHGHTPKPEPQLRPNRIGIDTGAVFGGKLTAVVLGAGEIEFLQV